MDLIICDIPWYSGLSHYALEVGRVLVNAGITVYWATPEGTDLWSRLKNEKFNLLPIKSRHSRHFFSNYSSITKGLDKQSPERILSFTGSSLLLGYFLKRRYKSKLFRFRTESLKLKKNIFNRMLYNKCDYVVAGNKKIESEINGIGISKTAVIYSPVDYELYHQLSPERVKKIGFLGRLDYIKGFDILIPAMNHIWERYPDITLHIAGREVNYKWPEIRDRFHGPVYYHGYLNHDQVIDFLKDMDLGVLPSKGSEMTSRALLEWWSSAKPVIASRVGIFPELIEHKKNGYLISPENSDELTEAIIFFIKNPEFLKTTGMWGLNKVKIELSFKVFSDNLKKIL